MSDFERGLRRARARHHGLYLIGAAGLVVVALVTAGLIAFAGGTPIRVQPAAASDDAEITVTGGLAVEVDRVIYSLLGEPEISVRAEGFAPYQGAVSADQIGGPVTVTLTELPAILALTAEPADDRTRWSIDGTPVDTGAALDREVAAGRYTVEVENPYFLPIVREVEAVRGETLSLRLLLTPVSGKLTVDSVPQGAAVSIDGEDMGQTPLDLALPGGTYDVEVAADGYNAVTDRLEITRQAPDVARSYRLRPLSATLTVDVFPPGGDLLLSGRAIAADTPIRVDANTGHTVTYFKPGHFPATREVSLAPGARERLRIELEADVGVVDVTSRPAAQVFVDGAPAGETPIRLQLLAVPHRIELRRPGYRSVARTVSPSSKRAVSIDERLRTESAARLAEAKPEYTNGAGIQLKLFTPDGFRMGAPRHQRGQRANEFEKDVTLRKPFYAAKHEVTNAQFSRFRPGHGGRPNEPVVAVSWIDAVAFANWLSGEAGLAPFYRIRGGRLLGVNAGADGYRLLTEAEWEWLARKAGKREQTVFPWGDDPVVPAGAGNIADESANGITPFYVPNYTDGHARLAPVASYPPEASGLYDLTGNVSEWTNDFYTLLPPGPAEVFVDPLGPATGSTHVVKGQAGARERGPGCARPTGMASRAGATISVSGWAGTSRARNRCRGKRLRQGLRSGDRRMSRAADRVGGRLPFRSRRRSNWPLVGLIAAVVLLVALLAVLTFASAQSGPSAFNLNSPASFPVDI